MDISRSPRKCKKMFGETDCKAKRSWYPGVSWGLLGSPGDSWGSSGVLLGSPGALLGFSWGLLEKQNYKIYLIKLKKP
jgi:hypothetical protein